MSKKFKPVLTMAFGTIFGTICGFAVSYWLALIAKLAWLGMKAGWRTFQ